MTKVTLVEAADAGVSADDLAAFVAREWEWPVALAEPDFYRWQLEQSPLSAGRDRSIVMLDAKDAVGGFMGINPRPFAGPGWETVGAETTTWVISPALRGGGLGGRLFRFLQERYDVITGGRGTDLSFPSFRLAGFKRVREMPRLVRVLDSARLGAAGDVGTLGSRLLVAARDVGSDAAYEADALETIAAAAAAASLAPDAVGYGRAADYLRWRYDDHPVYRYEAFEVRHDGGAAAVVIRMHESDGVRAAHVVELLGAPASVPAVAHLLDDLGRERGVAFVDFYCMAWSLLAPLWAAGWMSTIDDSEVRVADRLAPPELREPCTTSVLLWARDHMPDILDFGRLYLTKGDMDLDRPPVSVYRAMHARS